MSGKDSAMEGRNSNPMKLLQAAACGLAFGFALHKAEVFKAEVIREQFRFTNLTMLKTFLSAAGTSTLAMAALYSSKNKDTATIGAHYKTYSGLVSTAIGGATLGIGMAFAGTCPGTIYAQLGAGSLASLKTYGAAIVGAIVYTLLHDDIEKGLHKAGKILKQSLDDLLGVSHTTAAVGFALMCYAIAFGCDNLVSHNGPAMFDFSGPFWNPILAGMIIGAVQVPLVLGIGANLGTSSTFAMIGSWLMTPFLKGPRYAALHAYKHTYYWQLTMTLCTALGSYLAYATSANDTFYDVSSSGITLPQQLFGGFLISFGARVANGCTSGHGISGMAHLALRSFVAVACMFAGGIATTLILGL